MSRYDLLPPNATQLERDISRATSSLQRVAPPVPIIRTAKRIDIPDSVVPWLIFEYGLGEILPYLGNNQRLALQDGVLWQRIRGTPESVHIALGWIGIDGLIEEPEGGTDRWAEYMLGLEAATEGDEIIDRIAAVSRISSPVRSRLQRIYAVYDFRRVVLDECAWDDGSIYDDHSGVRPRPDWPQISYGRIHPGYVAYDPVAMLASTKPQYIAGYVQLIDTWRLDEDLLDEGWHILNYESLRTTQQGVSAQYVGQNWAPSKWGAVKWGDLNVFASGALNPYKPIDPSFNVDYLLIEGVTNIADSSSFARTLTYSAPVISTEQAIFGSSSIKFNGAGGIFLSDFEVPSPYCFEVWFHAARSTTNLILGFWLDKFMISLNHQSTPGRVQCFISHTGSSRYQFGGQRFYTQDNAFLSNQWNKLILLDDGVSERLLINDVLIGSRAVVNPGITSYLPIRRIADYSGIGFTGYMSGLRVATR